MKKHLAWVVSAFLVGAGATSEATAEPLLFEYTGTVRNITLIQGATDTLGLSQGMALSGSFIFDPTGPDGTPGPQSSFFTYSVTNASFAGYSAQPNHVGYTYFTIDADPARDVVNAYQSAAYGNTFEVFEFMLESPAPNSVLGGDQVNLLALSMPDFDTSDSRFDFVRATFLPDGTVPRTMISASINSLHVTPIPEPSTFALSACGLVIVGVAMRRRHVGHFSQIPS